MNLLINLAMRFERSPDGQVWTPGSFAYSFWPSYLEVFERVRVLARVRDVAIAPAGWKRADGPNVTFAAVPYYRGPWQYLLRARQVRTAVQQAIHPDDAVILRVPCPLAGCLKQALRCSGHPYAAEVVGDPYEVFAPGSVRHLLRPFLRWYFPKQLRQQCASACAAAYVTRHSLPSRYPCPGYSAFFSDVELPPEAFVSSPRPADPARRAFTLITVGSLEQMYKAPDVLLDAVALCVRNGWDIRLKLAGDGRHRPMLEARAAALGLAERAIFLGQVSTVEGVRAALDSADLFVLPSRTEGLPRAMIEAMARALPCLGSRVGGVPELLSDESLVEPGDVPGLAAKIIEVLADPERLARMSARNLEKAGEYRPEVLRERRLAFYRYVHDRTRAWVDGQERGEPAPPSRQARSAPAPNSTPVKTAANFRLLYVCTVPQTTLAFLDHQAVYVRGRGDEVHAVASPGKELGVFAAQTGAEVHAIEMTRRITPLADLRSLWQLVRLMRRLRPDVVHGHTPKGGLLAMIAAWLCRVPVRVYHLHGLPMVTATGAKRRLLRWCERVSCRLAHQVFCVSHSLREVALAEGLGGPDKLAVLLNGTINGLDAEGKFNPARMPSGTRAAVRSECGIPVGAAVVGFVGRLARDKGMAELSEAWTSLRAEYPELHLLLVGPPEPNDPLPEKVERILHGDDRIHWTGEVEIGNTPRFYQAMDVLVLPTYREGFSTVLLEAAAMELPVVATRIPGCVDPVCDGETGTLVPVRDSGALTEAVRGYLKDADLCRRHGTAGRIRVLRDFRPQDLSEALHREYLRLLRDRGIRVSPAPVSPSGCAPDATAAGTGRLLA